MRIFKALPPAERLRELFTYDPATGVLLWRVGSKAGKPAGCKKIDKRTGHHGGIYVTIRPDQYWAHRIIWAMVKGDIPTHLEVDHRDTDSWNNRWDNLRLATRSQNAMNMRRPRGHRDLPKGVTQSAEGWFKAVIKVGSRYVPLGTFVTAQQAAEAYARAAKQYHGEFARVS
jgi:hypothetical protein